MRMWMWKDCKFGSVMRIRDSNCVCKFGWRCARTMGLLKVFWIFEGRRDWWVRSFWVLHVLPKKEKRKKRRNKINLILFFSFGFFFILFYLMWLFFIYRNYCEIKGREIHVAWVMSATVDFNNILILPLVISDIFIYWPMERTKKTRVNWSRD